MTTMGDVPDKVRHEMTVGARHIFSTLERAFPYQKAASKRSYEAYISDLHQNINRLRWSDPGFTRLQPCIETQRKEDTMKRNKSTACGHLVVGFLCAWVLWKADPPESSGVVAWLQKWVVVEAFEPRKQCQEAQAKIIQTEVKNGSKLIRGDVIEVIVTSRTESERALEQLEIRRRKEQGKPAPEPPAPRTRQVRYFCSPDSIDPRPKVQSPTR